MEPARERFNILFEKLADLANYHSRVSRICMALRAVPSGAA